MFMAKILNVVNLSKIFTIHILGGKVITGCREVGFSLGAGEFLGITGPSGSGKTSVLKCVYRTYLPSGGEINYISAARGAVDLAKATDQEVLYLRSGEIGYVSQFLRVIPRVAALDVVAEGLLRRGRELAEARALAGEYLARLGIPGDLWDAYPATFSGGEQQRVNIARALITRPRLLLLDEPTASLDSRAKMTVVEMLWELKAAGTAMIGIFHDLETMRKLVDHTIAMNGGRCLSLTGR
jgi:alpha-D-ribose 1-methylphosphonate 5-triphosphate synthase subunit PhnL